MVRLSSSRALTFLWFIFPQLYAVEKGGEIRPDTGQDSALSSNKPRLSDEENTTEKITFNSTINDQLSKLESQRIDDRSKGFLTLENLIFEDETRDDRSVHVRVKRSDSKSAGQPGMDADKKHILSDELGPPAVWDDGTFWTNVDAITENRINSARLPTSAEQSENVIETKDGDDRLAPESVSRNDTFEVAPPGRARRGGTNEGAKKRTTPKRRSESTSKIGAKKRRRGVKNEKIHTRDSSNVAKPESRVDKREIRVDSTRSENPSDEKKSPYDEVGDDGREETNLKEKSHGSQSFDEIRELMKKLSDRIVDLSSSCSGDARRETRSREAEMRAPSRTNSASRENKRMGSKRSRDTREKISFEAGRTKSAKLNEGRNESRRSSKLVGIEKARGIRRMKRKSRKKWDNWTDWSSCSVTCGKGRQIRWRHCLRDCMAETEMEEKTCQLPACGPGKFLGIF